MDLKKHIQNVEALRDDVKALKQPTASQRDVLTRTTALLGRLALAVSEAEVTATAQKQLDESVAKAVAGDQKK